MALAESDIAFGRVPVNSSPVKQISLQELAFRLREAVPDHYPTQISYITGDFLKCLYLELREDIWAEKLQDTEKEVKFEFSYPAGWWQYFKQDYFPEWLLKRFPVIKVEIKQWKTVQFQRFAAFPECQDTTERGRAKFVMHEYIKEY